MTPYPAAAEFIPHAFSSVQRASCYLVRSEFLQRRTGCATGPHVPRAFTKDRIGKAYESDGERRAWRCPLHPLTDPRKEGH